MSDVDAAPAPGGATPPSRVGRPSVIDRERIGVIAFRLWDEQGYAHTTLTDIAHASGVSVRTLRRHFGSQAELVSTGIGPAIERLRAAFAQPPRDADPAAQLRALVTAAVRQDHSEAFSLVWQRVLTREPELRDAFTRVGGQWTDAFADIVGDVMPGTPPGMCHAIAGALHAVASRALLDWADAGGVGDPADAVARALAWIEVRDPRQDVRPAHSTERNTDV